MESEKAKIEEQLKKYRQKERIGGREEKDEAREKGRGASKGGSESENKGAAS